MNQEDESTLVLAKKLVREAVIKAQGSDGEKGNANDLNSVDAALVYLGGDLHGQRILLRPGKNVLGRDEMADIFLDYDGVSRLHAAVWWHESRASFVVEDMGSKNGIALNGQRVTGLQAISHGDEIILGPIRFILELGEKTRPPTVNAENQNTANSINEVVDPIKEPVFNGATLIQSARSLGDTVIVVISLVALTGLAAAWYLAMNRTF